MSEKRLKKWEIALICTVAAALLSGAAPCGAWWGSVYPEAAPDVAGVQAAAAAAAEGAELRFRLLEWLEALLRALGIG